MFQEDVVKDYIIKAVELCGQRIAPDTLQSITVSNEGIKDGISVWVILLESHFTYFAGFIHTWPIQAFARIEMSSCNPPDDSVIPKLERLTEQYFGGKANMKAIKW